jgi:excisionase family DNA binding protein
MDKTPLPDCEYITPDELAARLGCNTRTLRRWRQSGKVPKPVTIGYRPRWHRDVIEAFTRQHKPGP